jgi:hypothetical protein
MMVARCSKDLPITVSASSSLIVTAPSQIASYLASGQKSHLYELVNR